MVDPLLQGCHLHPHPLARDLEIGVCSLPGQSLGLAVSIKVQGESGGSVISVNARTDRDRDGLGMEEVLFEAEATFGLPTGEAVRAHHNTANLLTVEEEETDNEVFAFLWDTRKPGCGASVGTQGKFCTSANCRVASHCNAECIPVTGNWYIPASNKASWALSVPMLKDADLSEDIRASLEFPKNPITMKAFFT